MKFIFGLAALVLLSVSCKKPVESVSTELSGDLVHKASRVAVPEGEPMSQEDLDAFVLATMERENDFRWEWVNIKTIWSAIQYGDQSVAIGYKPASLGDIAPIIHQIDLKSGAWKEVHDNLINLILENLRTTNPSIKLEDILIEDDQTLPILTFKLTDKVVLTELYNLENVRYIEPLDYWPAGEERSSSGCSNSTYGLNTADYSSTTPNCLVPWNFNNVNIVPAWGIAQGQGITIGLIDAGISSSQVLLGAQFNSGDSNVGRSITTDYTLGSSAYTTCSHGTSMSGLAAGPRNSTGATTGVAYKSNLHFIRACDDVVLDASNERTGVKNALVKMGNKADVKVVSLSVGTPFYSSVLLDGVNYAYNNGKMIMAAAGTSTGWLSWWGVVYPAAFSNCVAITGVKENNATCASCHNGAEVDFTIPMERNNNDNRNSLSLATSGNTPTYIGGSSAATATAAGIAALVWSVNPSFTRAQAYNFLLTTSQFYPSANGSTGYGNLNAQAAVNAAVAPI